MLIVFSYKWINLRLFGDWELNQHSRKSTSRSQVFAHSFFLHDMASQRNKGTGYIKDMPFIVHVLHVTKETNHRYRTEMLPYLACFTNTAKTDRGIHVGSCFGGENERGHSVWEFTAVRFRRSDAGCPQSPLHSQGHWDELRHLLQPANKRNLRTAQHSPSFFCSLYGLLIQRSRVCSIECAWS